MSGASSAMHLVEPTANDSVEARLTSQLDTQRRQVRFLEGLASAVHEGDSVDALLTQLLQLFMSHTGAGVAVARLRDGQVLRSRAAVGLGDEVSRGYGVGTAQVFGNRPVRELEPEIVPVAEPNPLGSPGSVEGVAAVLRVPLVEKDELVGAIWLGLPQGPQVSDEELLVLRSLGARAAAAVKGRIVREGLERAVRSRDEILGIVAHDLRNPLNVISAAANSLHHRTSDAVSRRPLERIIRAAQRAEHLIRDLLDLSAIEGGHFSIEKRPIDTANVILTALDSQQGLAATSCVILASDISPALPWVDADEERILEVLENLLGNAVKFTMAGGTVTVGAGLRNQTLTIWVKDNGPGIAADQLTHLFDRFW